jgi:hypothetical protein
MKEQAVPRCSQSSRQTCGTDTHASKSSLMRFGKPEIEKTGRWLSARILSILAVKRGHLIWIWICIWREVRHCVRDSRAKRMMQRGKSDTTKRNAVETHEESTANSNVRRLQKRKGRTIGSSHTIMGMLPLNHW